jgi:hypothetical protein
MKKLNKHKNWRYFIGKYICGLPEGFSKYTPNYFQRLVLFFLLKSMPDKSWYIPYKQLIKIYKIKGSKNNDQMSQLPKRGQN